MSKYCIKCETKLSDDDLFCIKCGTKQDEVEEPILVDSNELVDPIADDENKDEGAIAAETIEKADNEFAAIPAEGSIQPLNITNEIPKKNKFKLRSDIIAAVVVVVIIILVTALSSRNGKSIDSEPSPTNSTGVNSSDANITETEGTRKPSDASNNDLYILNRNSEEVLSELLNRGYDVFNYNTENYSDNPLRVPVSEQRLGAFKNISMFETNISSDVGIYQALYGDATMENYDDYPLWIYLFVKDDIVISYHVLLNISTYVSCSEYLNNTEFEITDLRNFKTFDHPIVDELLGLGRNGQAWTQNNKRLVYSDDNYMLQFEAIWLNEYYQPVSFFVSTNLSNDEGSNGTIGGNNETTSDDINVDENRFEKPEEILSGIVSLSGKLNIDGLSCYLQLEQPITYHDGNPGLEPITTDQVWIYENDVANLKDYGGMDVSLKGELFNYRGGGTLMFNGAPTVLNVSGTPEVAEKKSSYSNWSSTDKETILWDALEVLRTIIYRVPGVTDVRTLCNSDDLDQWCRDGFEPCPVNLQINGYWVEDDYNYSTYVYPYEDSITILMGTTGLMDAFQWTYSWDGECISGYDIEEYGTIEEFIEIEGLVK